MANTKLWKQVAKLAGWTKICDKTLTGVRDGRRLHIPLYTKNIDDALMLARDILSVYGESSFSLNYYYNQFDRQWLWRAAILSESKSAIAYGQSPTPAEAICKLYVAYKTKGRK